MNRHESATPVVTSRAGQALLAYGNGWHDADCAGYFGLDAACSCGLVEQVAAIEQGVATEVRASVVDDIRARVDFGELAGYCWGFAVPLVGPERAKKFEQEVVARAHASISSSSATETQDGPWKCRVCGGLGSHTVTGHETIPDHTFRPPATENRHESADMTSQVPSAPVVRGKYVPLQGRAALPDM